MQNFLLNILSRIFEPFLDYIITQLTVNIALNAQIGFTEDEQGHVRRVEGSGLILVVNHGREPIKISVVGLIFKNKSTMSLNAEIVPDITFPVVVEGKDHRIFLINRGLFESLGPVGIDSIKKVYITDSMLNTMSSGVPKLQKSAIVFSVFVPKEVEDAEQ